MLTTLILSTLFGQTYPAPPPPYAQPPGLAVAWGDKSPAAYPPAAPDPAIYPGKQQPYGVPPSKQQPQPYGIPTPPPKSPPLGVPPVYPQPQAQYGTPQTTTYGTPQYQPPSYGYAEPTCPPCRPNLGYAPPDDGGTVTRTGGGADLNGRKIIFRKNTGLGNLGASGKIGANARKRIVFKKNTF